jgi:hypothetical protein
VRYSGTGRHVSPAESGNTLPQSKEHYERLGDVSPQSKTRPTFSSSPLLHLLMVFSVRDFPNGYDELHRAGGALDLFPQLPG